jgi:WhiB family redox-sensing transcriptional regulator
MSANPTSPVVPLPDANLSVATLPAGHSSNWRHEAACLEQNPELFFPTGESESAQRQVLKAKQICHECPVRMACLSWALDLRQDHGVWGGLSAPERRNLLRRGLRRTGVGAAP